MGADLEGVKTWDGDDHQSRPDRDRTRIGDGDEAGGANRMAASRSKAVGIRDVAEAAGVSTATVSQVFNNKGEVAQATREKVLRIGALLGYRPNAIGQALRSGRSRVLGIVITHRDTAVWEQTYMPYYRSIIAGAAIEAVEHGYSIAAAGSAEDGTVETHLPLDGAIVVDPVPPDPTVEYCLAHGIAVVTDGDYPRSGAHPLRWVRSDMEHGIPMVLDHLAGRTPSSPRPALFVGPILDSYSRDTMEHYRRWCDAHGVTDQVVAMQPGQSPLEVARELVRRVPGEVSAVHCLNETYARAVSAAAREAGLTVPDDLQVSLVGDARAATADPRAVYVDLDPVETGAICARTLIALLDGHEATDVLRPVSLVAARVP